MHDQKGFTLIELMVVISIIGILAAVAIPQFSRYRDRAYRCEGYSLGGALRQEISAYYDTVGMLPMDNDALGLPEPEQITGKYVSAVSVDSGRVTVHYDSEMKSALAGKSAQLVPQINSGNPTGPLVWDWVWPQ